MNVVWEAGQNTDSDCVAAVFQILRQLSSHLQFGQLKLLVKLVSGVPLCSVNEHMLNLLSEVCDTATKHSPMDAVTPDLLSDDQGANLEHPALKALNVLWEMVIKSGDTDLGVSARKKISEVLHWTASKTSRPQVLLAMN